MARSNLVTSAFQKEKAKTVDFSENIAASDVKVSRNRHLIDYVKICEYCMSRSFLDLGQRSCIYKIQTGFSQKLLCRSESKFV